MGQEYDALLAAMNEGFASIHNRLDTFKDEFHIHQRRCAELFAGIATDTAVRKSQEEAKRTELASRINWGKVRTVIVGTLLTLISIAALKILFTHSGELMK